MENDGGWYYLHTNGDLIWKKFMPEDDSPFVVKIWKVVPEDRAVAWLICIEALALGARRARIDELAAKWGLTDEDAQHFVEHTDQFKLFMDGDMWCATFQDFVDLQESQAGFGKTALVAFANLASVGLRQKFPKCPAVVNKMGDIE